MKTASMIDPARRPRPLVYEAGAFPRGTYVLATKYTDGHPGDGWCVGFYYGSFGHFGTARHIVVDSQGQTFRHNGFRRVAKLGDRRGRWIVEHMEMIERLMDRYSMWHWYRAPWSELAAVDQATHQDASHARTSARSWL